MLHTKYKEIQTHYPFLHCLPLFVNVNENVSPHYSLSLSLFQVFLLPLNTRHWTHNPRWNPCTLWNGGILMNSGPNKSTAQSDGGAHPYRESEGSCHFSGRTQLLQAGWWKNCAHREVPRHARYTHSTPQRILKLHKYAHRFRHWSSGFVQTKGPSTHWCRI